MAAYDTTTNVWTAASDGDLETVRRCIENGMAPHTPDAQGYTCLHAAASYGHHELLRFLIARPGVNLNCGDEDGDTPLHVVEDLESCRMLLAAVGAGSTRNGDGLTPAGGGPQGMTNEMAALRPMPKRLRMTTKTKGIR